MNDRLEYFHFINNTWQIISYGQWLNLKCQENYKDVIHRFTYYSHIETVESWYRGQDFHRLDGPAYLRQYKGNNHEFWYVNGICLQQFGFFGDKPSAEYIFNYIRDLPCYIKEIIVLCEHNHWLDKEQLVLIKCHTLFL